MKAGVGMIALGTLLFLAACGNEVERSADDGRTASGEVLGGTISDDMLPLDTVRSQSPPLREAPASATTNGDENSEPEEVTDTQPEAEPPPPPPAQLQTPAPADEG